MRKFMIEDEFWSLFPYSKIGVVVCHGIDNSIKDKEKYDDIISNGIELYNDGRVENLDY